MAQKIVYTCNGCLKEIGPKRHISLVMASHAQASGIAIPMDADVKEGRGKWDVVPFGCQNFIHFCSGKCIGSFFGKILKEAKIF